MSTNINTNTKSGSNTSDNLFHCTFRRDRVLGVSREDEVIPYPGVHSAIELSIFVVCLFLCFLLGRYYEVIGACTFLMFPVIVLSILGGLNVFLMRMFFKKLCWLSREKSSLNTTYKIVVRLDGEENISFYFKSEEICCQAYDDLADDLELKLESSLDYIEFDYCKYLLLETEIFSGASSATSAT